MDRRLDILCANTIRVLSADAIEKANSGHPGLPLGAVDFAYILWLKFLRHYNKEPKWLNRDRFVLSAGHGSMLLYSLLHLFDYPMPLDEIKKFRQIGSLTPGHPEYGHTIGVETTTVPLGQGFANAVGMAIAEKMMQARLNKFGKEIINHKIFVLAGDGCIMEGITSEAASFAGHLCLNNLIVVYDDNNITIEGNTNITFSEDVCKKFEAMGWDTYSIDGHNFDEIEQTFEKVLKNQEKPVLIKAKTIIGKGAPTKNNHCDVHGSPLGKEELRRLKENLGFNPDEYFAISQEVYDVFKKRNEYLEKQYKEWQKEFEELYHNNSEFRRVYDLYFNNEIKLENLKEDLYKLFEKDKSIATRAASGKIMNFISEQIPALIGGSADLGTSTKTILDKYPFIEKNKFDGRNFHFGVREHSMAAICNGIALYGGFIPYCSSFFVFTDYLRPALRLSALMKLQVIYIMTHDSIFVGEDGPTHQPIEQTMCYKMIPNLLIFRPADAIETVDVWLKALAEKNRPSLVLLTRQNLPIIDRKKYNQ
ncbi:MAG TPA: transketolase, partial [bacterium]|nr:transketolase [bacterium]